MRLPQRHGLKQLEIRKITKNDCLNWAARYGKQISRSAFNHTIGALRGIIEIGVETGSRSDNPARFIKRVSEKPKKLRLPELAQFDLFVEEISNGGSRHSRNCADLVRFLAFGGFRKAEAAHVTWADCDFKRSQIVVRGDPLTGTKNSTVRRVPMIPEMRHLLERLKVARPDGKPDEPVMRVAPRTFAQ